MKGRTIERNDKNLPSVYALHECFGQAEGRSTGTPSGSPTEIVGSQVPRPLSSAAYLGTLAESWIRAEVLRLTGGTLAHCATRYRTLPFELNAYPVMLLMPTVCRASHLLPEGI